MQGILYRMSNADMGAGAGHISPLPFHSTPHPSPPALAANDCRWVNGVRRALTWHCLEMVDHMMLQLYSVLVNDCDRRYQSTIDRDRTQPYIADKIAHLPVIELKLT